MIAYLIQYNGEFEDVVGIEQLKEFAQYRITVEEDNERFNYKDYDNLTEEECLEILEIDGYSVQVFEIY